jgi:hypothetical protein
MTKLLSGRVKKVGSANVSSTRYDYIKLSETEPDLGLPAANGYVLSANTDGTRHWVLPVTAADVANISVNVSANLSLNSINELVDVDTATHPPINGYGLVWNGTNWVPNVITVSSTELANIANVVLGLVGASIVANNAAYANLASRANTATYANIAVFANTAGNVLTLSNFTTSNLAEGTNLYYTNARARSAISAGDSSITYDPVTGTIRASANVSANITAALNGLTTANIAEAASNLYYTNARAIAAITGNTLSTLTVNYLSAVSWNNLYTGNVSETAGNLYYTNARVYSNVIGFLPSLAGTGINIAANGQISANTSAILGTLSNINGNLTVAGNINTTNAIKANSFITSGSISANVINTNYINANVWQGLYTANVIESQSGLYYTNARVYANIGPLLNAKANVGDLTTANVVESVNNLYYTNNRVYANVLELLPTLAGNNISIAANGQISANTTAIIGSISSINGNLTVTGNLNVAETITASNIITGSGFGGSITGANLISANYIQGNVWQGIYTANVIESASNLYYSNDRVYANVAPLLATKANVTDLTTANVIESASNLYYTNARVYANVAPLLVTKANVTDLTTANVIESLGNLYYTNARSRAALSAGTGISYDKNTGVISSSQDTSTTGTVTFANLTVTGQTNFYGSITTHTSNNLSISDNMIYLNSGSESSNPDMGFAGNYNDGTYHHAGFFRDALDNGTWKVFENYAPEPDANIFINTSHATFRLANMAATTFIGNVRGTVSTLSNFTTSNLAEGTNLYYTNARVYANVLPLLSSKANITDLTTANITEAASNLYFTNARVYANVAPLLATKANVTDLTTANVLESASNLYYTNARVYANILALLPTLAGNNISIAANGQISANTNAILGSISSITGNLAVTGNLNVLNGITANSIRINGVDVVTGSGAFTNINATNVSVNSITSNVWNGIYTTNVIESGNNLYYTNNRVYANVLALLPTLAGNGIIIAANGQISANVLAITGGLSVSNLIGNVSVTGNLLVTNGITANSLRINGVEIVSGDETATNLNATNVRVNLVASNIWSGIYTANVIESASNLYFTNARVYSNVIALLPTLAGDNITVAANGRISANLTNVSFSNISGNITVTGNINATGGIVANSIGIASSGAPTVYSDSNITLSALSGTVFINSQNTIATGNITTSQTIYANSIVIRGTELVSGNETALNLNATNVVVNAVTSNVWNGIYTANVLESAGNLYYTNNRVYANVLALLPTLAGSGIAIAANGQISASGATSLIGNITVTGNLAVTNGITANSIRINGVDVVTGAGAFTNINATNVTVNAVTANIWTGIYTANVLETAGNLYFTNARVYANIAPLLSAKANVSDLTTANVIESASNLYYTNARVYANVAPLLVTKANVTDLTTANVVESASNLYYTNARVYANVAPLLVAKANVTDLTTANVIESAANLYFTNARAVAAIVNSALSNLTVTGNIVAGNISVNTGTISANVINANYHIGNVWQGIYTANVLETASNLYYTNARVYANVIGFLPSLAGNGISISANGQINAVGTPTASISNLFANLWVTGNVNAGNVIANSLISAGAGTGSITSTSDFVINAAGNIILNANNLIANNFVSTGTGSSYISSTTNLSITAPNVVTTGNLFVSGTFVSSNISATGVTATLWTGIYTSNIIESGNVNTGNVYFTNARARAAFIAGGNITIDANGVISSSAGVSNAISNITSNLTVTGNIIAGNVISNAFISAGAGTGSISSTGDFAINAGGNIILNANNLIANNFVSTGTGSSFISSTSNLAITAPNVVVTSNSLVVSGNIYAANFIGNVTASITNLNSFTTSNLAEGSNLYYTNARVFSALSGGTGVNYSNTTGVISIGQNVATTANVTFAQLNVTGVTNFYGNVITHSSNNLSISDNMIYLNSDSTASNPDLGFAGNYNDGTYHHAGFFRDARSGGTWKVFENYSPEPDANIFIDQTHPTFRLANLAATTFIGNIQGTVSTLSNFSTSNLAEGSNLYYTNTRVYANVSPLLAAKANVTDLTTANVIESASNLYYTNARVYANVAPLLVTKANVTDLTTANVIETSGNLYFTNARVYSNILALLPTLAGNNITIAANGQISSTATGGGGNTSPTANLNVAVQEFIGNGVQTVFSLTNPVNNSSNVLVTVDGLMLTPSYDYTTVGTVLTISNPPPYATNVVVRYFSGVNIAVTNIASNVVSRTSSYAFARMFT